MSQVKTEESPSYQRTAVAGQVEMLKPDLTLPLLIQPETAGLNLNVWAEANKDFLDEKLLKHGAVLLRGFAIRSVPEFEKFSRMACRQLLEYRERSSPRSQVAGLVYTSTDYPADQNIFLHNENSYQYTTNGKIFFFCFNPAREGGETPIADCRRIYQRIDPEIRQRFIEKQWMYKRNFGDGFGLPWQTVFQTTDKSTVEEHCAKRNITVEWKSNNRLRISAVLPAIARHPQTNDISWFNHATFFNVSTLSKSVGSALMEEFGEEDLPTNTYYGDGSPIEPEVLEHLRQAYESETVSFLWQRGDVMVVDNLLVAHGRAPYSGPRKIMVAMGDPISRDQLL